MEWLIYQHGNWMSRTKGVKDVTEKEEGWGWVGQKPVPALPADPQLQHKHGALVTSEDVLPAGDEFPTREFIRTS